MYKTKNFPSYEEANKIVIENGIMNASEYKAFYKELGLPANPNICYKDRGWTNWSEFCGGEKKSFPSYEEAKKIVIENGIKNKIEYKAKFKELGLPSHPELSYNDTGWTNWSEFYGREKKSFPSYEAAKKILIENGIKSWGEYKAFHKELGLPSHPDYYYKDTGWTDWYDFLGISKRISSSERKFKVLTTLSINPILLEDNAPLQVIYMLASQLDKKLANEIEELLDCTSYEDKLNWVKEQLKSLKADTDTTSRTRSGSATDELSAMESVMEVFEDTMEGLSEEDTSYINRILGNYYHNAVNRELIAEFDD